MIDQQQLVFSILIILSLFPSLVIIIFPSSVYLYNLITLLVPVLLRPDSLLASHVSEWEHFWRNDFNIQAHGNLELSRVIHVSLYAIVSALPSKNSNQVHDELFYGLSPTGLGRGGSKLDDYEGLKWKRPESVPFNSNPSCFQGITSGTLRPGCSPRSSPWTRSGHVNYSIIVTPNWKVLGTMPGRRITKAPGEFLLLLSNIRSRFCP